MEADADKLGLEPGSIRSVLEAKVSELGAELEAFILVYSDGENLTTVACGDPTDILASVKAMLYTVQDKLGPADVERN